MLSYKVMSSLYICVCVFKEHTSKSTNPNKSYKMLAYKTKYSLTYQTLLAVVIAM